MFEEIPNVRQIKGEPRRRWFSDGDLELIVWFQLCYESESLPKEIADFVKSKLAEYKTEKG